MIFADYLKPMVLHISVYVSGIILMMRMVMDMAVEIMT